jgi:hypothetical protein
MGQPSCLENLSLGKLSQAIVQRQLTNDIFHSIQDIAIHAGKDLLSFHIGSCAPP